MVKGIGDYMSTIKYLNENNEWVDYVEKKSGIYTFNGDYWEDGAENELNPSITVSFYDGAKWIQKYPNAYVLYQYTLKGEGSKMKYTHSKNSSKTWGTSSPLSAVGGVWESGAIYSGWLNLAKPSSIPGGIGNVADIKDIKCSYTRRGVGYWEYELPISLVGSTLTSAYGTGTTAHSSKKSSTIYSDTGMNVCTKTNELVKGATTFNSDSAKEFFKNFLNGSYNSILLGQKESKGNYISLTDIEITTTYTCNIASATFNTKDSVLLSNRREATYTMFIYDNEVGMSYDEIMENRRKNNIKDIKDEDIIFKN